MSHSTIELILLGVSSYSECSFCWQSFLVLDMWMSLESGGHAHFEWKGSICFLLSYFNLVCFFFFSLSPSLCSPLQAQWFLLPPASLNFHYGIGTSVGTLMLLPHSDVGDIAELDTWPAAWLGLDSKAVFLSFCFPGQWVGSSLFSASSHKFLTLRTKPGYCPPPSLAPL